VQVLEQGGNAVDAAVAVAYALSVTHPSAASVGGGGFMLLRVEGNTYALDFREVAPKGLTQKRFDEMIAHGGVGPVSVGVPGFVAGMELVHERFGKMSRRSVMSAAIELAKNGYLLGSRQAQSLAWNWAILGRMPEFRRRFGQAAGEGPKTEGQRVTRPRLANTLEGIAKDGGRHFYAGPVAKSIALGLEKSAAWTEADLGNYRAKWRDPLTF
jgi:gamma-glutamyltranspeptidase/glutathione hydrolase